MRLALIGPVFLGMIRVRAAPDRVRVFDVSAARFVVRLVIASILLSLTKYCGEVYPIAYAVYMWEQRL